MTCLSARKETFIWIGAVINFDKYSILDGKSVMKHNTYPIPLLRVSAYSINIWLIRRLKVVLDYLIRIFNSIVTFIHIYTGVYGLSFIYFQIFNLYGWYFTWDCKFNHSAYYIDAKHYSTMNRIYVINFKQYNLCYQFQTAKFVEI